MPIVITFTNLAVFAVRRCVLIRPAGYPDEREMMKARAAVTDTHVKLWLLLVFMVYPSVCATILQLYKCKQIGETYYLTVDARIVCFDSEWATYAIIGGVACAVYASRSRPFAQHHAEYGAVCVCV